MRGSFATALCLAFAVIVPRIQGYALMSGNPIFRGRRPRFLTSAASSRNHNQQYYSLSSTGPFGLSFAWPPKDKNPFSQVSLFGGKKKISSVVVDPKQEKREQLKKKLVEICQTRKDSPDKRAIIEELIQQLAELSPVKKTSTSPLLKKEWSLVWTSEKEINFFIERRWSLQITQTLQDSVLNNWIPFVGGGGLVVKGSIRPKAEDGEDVIDSNGGGSNPQRTLFQFDSAKLDLGKWGTYNLPPVGRGWFDTVYLDNDFRVDLNSRNDILICSAINK